MSRLFIDGFETGNILKPFENFRYNLSFNPIVVHKDDYGLYNGNLIAPPYGNYSLIHKNISEIIPLELSLGHIQNGGLSEFYLKWRLQVSETGFSSSLITLYNNSRTIIGTLYYFANPLLRYVGGETIDGTIKKVTYQWYLMELFFKMSTDKNTSDGIIVVHVDGAEKIADYNAKTSNLSSPDTVQFITFGTMGFNSYMLLDDIILDSTSAFDIRSTSGITSRYPDSTGVYDIWRTEPEGGNKTSKVNKYGEDINDTFIKVESSYVPTSNGSGSFYGGADSDDGCVTGINLYTTFNAFGNAYEGWFIFFVTIPQGATITTAYTTFTSNATRASSGDLILSFSKEDNATAPVNATDFNEKNRTEETVVWTPGGWTNNSKYSTPSLVNPLQQIVDRPGYSSGNAVLLLVDQLTCSNNLNSDDRGDAEADWPVLYVEWTQTTEAKQSFIISPSAIDSTAIHCIQTTYKVQKRGSEADNISEFLVVDGVDYSSSDKAVGINEPTTIINLWENNPSTGSEFTPNELDNIEIGITLRQNILS